jgi:hypothetical protein
MLSLTEGYLSPCLSRSRALSLSLSLLSPCSLPLPPSKKESLGQITPLHVVILGPTFPRGKVFIKKVKIFLFSGNCHKWSLPFTSALSSLCHLSMLTSWVLSVHSFSSAYHGFWCHCFYSALHWDSTVAIFLYPFTYNYQDFCISFYSFHPSYNFHCFPHFFFSDPFFCGLW